MGEARPGALEASPNRSLARAGTHKKLRLDSLPIWEGILPFSELVPMFLHGGRAQREERVARAD
jgi:hypothetical protein